MKVHLCGAVSFPGCVNYGLEYLAKENSHSYPVGSQFVARDFYVDDGHKYRHCGKGQLVHKARELCAKDALHIYKFLSNNHAVLKCLPSSECAIDAKTKDLTFNNIPLEQTLGIHWSIDENGFRFNNTLKDQPVTC